MEDNYYEIEEAWLAAKADMEDEGIEVLVDPKDQPSLSWEG